MNQKVIQTLEFHKIVHTLAEFASSPLGKSQCLNLLPSSDLEEILQMQEETADALSYIWKKGMPSFSGVKDIRSSLKRLSVGSSLSIYELLDISRLLDVALRIKSYARTEDSSNFDGETEADSKSGPAEEQETAATFHVLETYFSQIEPLTPLNNEMKRCILSEEEISDNASPALKDIRRRIRTANEQIHSQLTTMIHSSKTQSYLQESIITMRNGRYCLPVRQEYRSQIPGMIHDQSSTGATLFVEPMAVVKLNNSLKELSLKEQEEIEVILADLSNQCAEYIDALEANVTALAQLDFIFAKGGYAKSLKATQPVFNTEYNIRIKQGRHPLLDSKTVVPIDIHLGEDFDLLIITGPNTGGKTVSLKTAGLFSLMGQSGLHIPADDGSSLSVFEEIFADIGDEQSIEQSLSTFSSHMTRIVDILQKADFSSLVLFDELGAGTDPTEGAALAISILSHLHSYGIRTMATTHYSELKIYALSTPGVSNACCEFDIETLRPTYHLLIGIPGKSNAFAISEKLGLPKFLIENAKVQLNEEDEAFEDILSDLETNKSSIQKELEETKRLREEALRYQQQLKEKYERIDARREQILRDANEKANKILQEAKDFADTTIKNINKLSLGSGNTKELEKQRQQLRQKLDKTNAHLSIKTLSKSKKNHQPQDFHIGDQVKVLSMGLEGTVTSLPNAKGEVKVQMGILSSNLPIKDLEILQEKASPTVRQKTGKMNLSRAAQISSEINLLGKNVDDAIAALDKYLDDAYLSHLSTVRVVHGKGTGALRQGIHKYLKRLSYVKSYRLGEFGEGDAGVTIIEFK